MSVQPLLNEISLNLTALRKAEKLFAHKLAPSFNLFRYLRNDELGLSRSIADLLDPKGPHGQGTLFLEAFLELLPQTGRFEPRKLAKVILEHSTLEDRRIDILLKFENGLIGIEHKPWAADQYRQVEDYAQYLESTSPTDKNWTLVFLSDRAPSQESISCKRREDLTKRDHYIQIQFKAIESWLRRSSYKVAAPRVRTFVEELADYIKQQIIGELDMTEETEVCSIIKSSDQNLVAAVDIVKSWDSVTSQLLQDFERDLRESLVGHSELAYEEDEKSSIFLGHRGCGFDIRSKREDLQDIRLGFWFDKAGFGNFYLGVRPKDDIHPDDFVRSKNISDHLTAKICEGKSNHVWIWWVWADCHEIELGDGFRNWDTSSQPWVVIRNKELVKKVIELAKKVYDAIGEKKGATRSAD